MTPHAAPLILVTTAGKIGAEAQALSARDVAAVFSRVLGRPIAFHPIKQFVTDYAAAFSPTLVAR